MSDVRAFGAVGDGVTDDTAAIQHAIEEGDGQVVFTPGTYKITQTLTARLDRRGPLSLSGSRGVARLVMLGAGPALRLTGTHQKTADPNDFAREVWVSERMPTVSGLEIVGGHEQAVGVELNGTMQATFAGLLIRRCRYGVHLVNRNRNVLITHCHIYHGRRDGIGIYFDGVNLHQTNIVGCHISYHPHAGIKVERSEVRNLQITGCDIEYNFDPETPDSADVWVDAREKTVREVTIASNTIQAKNSPGGANVRIEGPELDDSRGAGLWTIVGNVLQSQETNLLLRRCRGVAVTGNSFASGFGRSVLIDACRVVTLGSNTFDHNPDYTGPIVDGIEVVGSSAINLTSLVLEGTRAGSVEKGAAITVAKSSEVAITACQVLDPLHRGVDLIDVRNTRLNACTVVDRRPDGTMREAVRWRGGGAPGNAAVENLIGKGTAGALEIEKGAAESRGNTILD